MPIFLKQTSILSSDLDLSVCLLPSLISPGKQGPNRFPEKNMGMIPIPTFSVDLRSSRFFHTNGWDRFGSRKGLISFVYLYCNQTEGEARNCWLEYGLYIYPKSFSRFRSFFRSRRRCRSLQRNKQVWLLSM